MRTHAGDDVERQRPTPAWLSRDNIRLGYPGRKAARRRRSPAVTLSLSPRRPGAPASRGEDSTMSPMSTYLRDDTLTISCDCHCHALGMPEDGRSSVSAAVNRRGTGPAGKAEAQTPTLRTCWLGCSR
jgi:hypothetical protein